MSYTPLSTSSLLEVRPQSSSPASSPVYTIHRVVHDAADSGDVTKASRGMNFYGFRTGTVRVVPSVSAQPSVEVLFWSEEAGKFISRFPKVESGGFGAGVPFELSFAAFGGVAFLKVTGGVTTGDTVTVLMAGSRRRAVESGIILPLELAQYSGGVDYSYVIGPPGAGVRGPYAENQLPYTVYQGRKYARVFRARTEQYTESQDISDVDWDKVRLISPTAQTDPVGGSTAWKLIPDTTPAQNHYVQQQLSYDGSSKYTIHCIAKSAGYGGLRLSFSTDAFPDNCVARFNLDAGTVGTKDAGFLTSSILSLGNGWYLCSATAQSDAAANSWSHVVVLQADETENFAGDGSSGIIVWNPQVEKGAYPSPPILTEATPITRDKDQLYWPAAAIPVVLKSGRFKFNFVPFHDSTVCNYGLFSIDRLGANEHYLYAYLSGGDIKFDMKNSGGVLVSAGPLSFSAYQELEITIDASGSIEISGATTGDGVYNGTSWILPDGKNLGWGQLYSESAGGFDQCDGLITSPYIP